MLEILTGTGLAFAAGLNAWIPLLLIGALDRFTGLIELPAGWAWLSNEWVLVILAALLVIEFVADKVPGVDSVNDVIQTVIRPTSGGLAFGSGSASTTVAVTDPAAFFSSNQWVPVVAGIVIALLVHLAKSSIRPLITATTAGLGGPVASVVEDLGSIAMSLFAIILPVLVIIGIAGSIVGVILIARRLLRKRRRPSPEGPGLPVSTSD
ncbi:DUF4126 domain-containing protein [Agromyces atrinae]|uniref:DUF4126 domain-containing protein n=1 Tax=Agromyces atrinae TaxID=592376 RepID=A0A4Q2M5N8_9MICO|nr:DUF4126 domain-containing protein [Agromyces atrinae]NYD66242.1 hypothetical protein [Agromyces atrinae]RXZ86577.1 DUF4126 domain-containing protein [Agromyces atrinae]